MKIAMKHVRRDNEFFSIRDWLRGEGAPFWWFSQPDPNGRKFWISQVTSGVGDLALGLRFCRFHGGAGSKWRPYGGGWDIWIQLPLLVIRFVWVTRPAPEPGKDGAK